VERKGLLKELGSSDIDRLFALDLHDDTDASTPDQRQNSQSHVNNLLSKLQLGEPNAAPSPAWKAAARGGQHHPNGAAPTLTLDPGLGHAAITSRGYFHRQILHKLFVSESVNLTVHPGAKSEA
jgi:hypothetical protein